MKKVSITELIEWVLCQRAWFLHRVLKYKPTPYIPFIIGGSVHDFTAGYLHKPFVPKPDDDNRSFFYIIDKSKNDPKIRYKTALKGFRGYWFKKIWVQNLGALSAKTLGYAYKTATKNLINYMRLAENFGPLPLNCIEIHLSMKIPELGCEVIGVIDQKRPTNDEWNIKHSIKSPGVVLIDLKTGRPYKRASLVNNVQSTTYCSLFKYNYGKFPDVFAFWFLGGEKSKVVTLTRNEYDEQELFRIIAEFREKIGTKQAIEHYLKTPNSYTCSFCQYAEACEKESRKLNPALSVPKTINSSNRPEDKSEPPEAVPPEPEQLRLGYTVARKKKLSKEKKEQRTVEKYKERMEEKKKQTKNPR